jgi:hypothetical protein
MILASVLAISVIGSVSAAEAAGRSWVRTTNTPVQDFVDIDFARSIWTGAGSRAEIESLEARHCEAEPVRRMVEELGLPQSQKVFVEYARDLPDLPEDLAKCIDVKGAKALYSIAAMEARHGRWEAFPYPNAWPPIAPEACDEFLRKTVLATDCSDLPDWRRENEKLSDARKAEREAKRFGN